MIQWKEIEVAIEAETIPTIMHRGKPIPVFLKTTDPVPTIGLFDGLRNSKEIKYDVVRGAWDFVSQNQNQQSFRRHMKECGAQVMVDAN